MPSTDIDVLIVGAGAAGMMAAIEAGRRGRRVRIIDHARAPGDKIRISGGGRCNFTNLGCGPHAFLGENPRFATSALKRFTQHDFIKRVDQAGIAWHEKTLGQLFCDDSAKLIIRMLTDQMREAGAVLSLGTSVDRLSREGEGFQVALSDGSNLRCASLILATGGKSIPKMGATGWAYDTARALGLRVTETRPALVPLTFEAGLLERLKPLAGVSVEAVVSHGKTKFAEGLLFTHRGLSGPSVLQISSYWREGETISVAMAPGVEVFAQLKAMKAGNGRQAAHTALGQIVPKRLAEVLVEQEEAVGNLADLSDRALRRLDQAVNGWSVKPVGSEGYRTAEVTLGGVATDQLDQQTMAAKRVPGLYVIGEAVDITGWLGGYNFQWAWSSGWAAGQVA
ncbi:MULTISPECIES: NAD(P)/FAD-dependent oxidoreductase [unclassified Brevundimonas]|uniref:NAD(P)/FAD-dependent oxidoreductase n=1 Tax=unclassified Brevundimonas TaxID=2622653 RepID=UPI000C559D3D|nr:MULTISPECIES: NAD(P)/FAD-dependent oxidoreductase [unclassified Brevundimonas]MAL89365.1 aminoacetone oxidase family FAD-binding enzyme [Brevundimonas sp.]HAJ02524.1 aminoacetone oxidase family FAD-binding enzyme [Brevundimonas sp.]